MALIKDRKLAHDSWQLLEGSAEARPEIPASGDVIVPLDVWRRLRAELPARDEGRRGVWLSGADDPDELAADLERIPLIAVQFTSFTDGRGYSIGRLLRERYAFRGELRAIGDVQRDQIFYLMRCGFDAFALRPGEDVAAVLAAFDDFSEPYQASVERPLPLFRRRDSVRAQ